MLADIESAIKALPESSRVIVEAYQRCHSERAAADDLSMDDRTFGRHLDVAAGAIRDWLNGRL